MKSGKQEYQQVQQSGDWKVGMDLKLRFTQTRVEKCGGLVESTLRGNIMIGQFYGDFELRGRDGAPAPEAEIVGVITQIAVPPRPLSEKEKLAVALANMDEETRARIEAAWKEKEAAR